MKRLALLLPIIAGVCWGGSGLFVRTLFAADFDNITITFSRISVSVLLMALYMLACGRETFRVSKKDLPLIALLGIMGFLFMNICYNEAMNTLSMSLASVLLCTAPVFVIIFSAILFGEKITKTKVICMLAALIGCSLLSGILDGNGLQWSIFGIVMGVGSSICNATYTMMTNEVTDVRKCHPMTVLFYASLVAMLLMIPMTDFGRISAFFMEAPLAHGMFYFVHAFATSLLPNLVYTISFKYADSGVVSILAAGAEPTAAMILGLIVYSEIPTIFGVAGMVITIGAMIMLTSAKEEKTENTRREAA